MVPAEIDRAAVAGDPPPPGLTPEEQHAYGGLKFTYKHVKVCALMQSGPRRFTVRDLPRPWPPTCRFGRRRAARRGGSRGSRPACKPNGELTRDEVLDSITLYWLTNTGVSAAKLYWEYKGGFFNVKGVKIPVAVLAFPGEQYLAPRTWTEKAYPKLFYYHEAAKGGHFAAWEQPQIFAEELRAAFKSLR